MSRDHVKRDVAKRRLINTILLGQRETIDERWRQEADKDKSVQTGTHEHIKEQSDHNQ